VQAPKYRQRSLLVWLASAVVVTVVGVLGFNAWYQYLSQRNAMIEAMQRDSAQSLGRLAKNAAPFIEAYAINEYDKLVSTEIELHRYHAIVVNDFNMAKVLGTPQFVSGKIHAEDGSLVDIDDADPAHKQSLERVFFKESRSIRSATGEPLGVVSIYISNEMMQQKLRQALIENVTISVTMAVFLIALLMLFVNRLLFRPLAQITQSIARQDGDGIPLATTPQFAYREIASLTDTINTMLNAIRISRASLQQERSRLESVIEGANAGTWEWNIETGELIINDRWAEMIGYSVAELTPATYETWSRKLHPLDLERTLPLLETHFAGDSPEYRAEIRMRHKQGHWVWILALGRVVSRSPDGKPLQMSGTHIDISERKHNEAEIIDQRRRLNDILIGTNAGTWEWNVQTGEVVFNQRWADMVGYGLEELAPLSIKTWNQLVHPDDLKRSSKLMREHFSGDLPYYECEARMRHKDGHWVWVLDRGKVNTWTEDGKPLFMSGTHMDITARKQTERYLQKLSTVVEQSPVSVVITDLDARIEYVNPRFSEVTGYTSAEVIGENPRILQSGETSNETYAEMWDSLNNGQIWKGELRNKRKNGEVYWESASISPVLDATGAITHFVALKTDISAFKEYQLHIEQLAHYDVLTGLPNRALLAERLHLQMSQALRRDKLLAVAYIDLDGFKAINDQHGHKAGDNLLVTISNRMKQTLRDVDTVARIGGDEFVVVLTDLSDIEESLPLLIRLLDAIGMPIIVDQAKLQVSGSIGVTFYPQADEIEADQLLRQADQAMYQAKLAGKNRYHVFDAEQDRSLRGHHESLESIKRALEKGEFVLHYQPKINMRSGRVIGLEALIRWRHPQLGQLSPAAFLPVIEEHPLMVGVGDWVIDAALRDMASWHAAGVFLSVSINVSARQLQERDFLTRLGAALARYPGIEPRNLELEILETSALADMELISGVIDEGFAMGFTFALDDFGTGYSSLTYLKRLPAQVLKIDQSFVRDMLDDHDDLAIIEGVLGLAAAFRREVIAEGVETINQGRLLLQLGCEMAQGYAIARPMPADAVPAWVASWRTFPEWADQAPVPREDVPMLYAAAGHRAWVKSLTDLVNGEHVCVPPMEPDQCLFGVWLQHESMQRYAGDPEFAAIGEIHREIHATGASMLEMFSRGRKDEAQAGLKSLLEKRDRLLAALESRISSRKDTGPV
jgi:diguanylate cyclase (GGDEF)-like protein/PAS domain S-box-containing protein